MVGIRSASTSNSIWAKHIQASSTEPNSPPSLELLSVELKIQILKYLPDTRSLQSLIHASPAFHNLYLKVRTEIFTAVTVTELKARSVDLLNPVVICEVRVDPKDQPGEEDKAPLQAIPLQAIYDDFKFPDDHWRNSSTVPVLKLSIEHCLSLLKIREMVAWMVEHRCSISRNKFRPLVIARRTKDYFRQPHWFRFCCTTADNSGRWYAKSRLTASRGVDRDEAWRSGRKRVPWVTLWD